MWQARLKLEWRRFLTQQLLHAYFSHRAFFNLKLLAAGIDNPDQARRVSFLESVRHTLTSVTGS